MSIGKRIAAGFAATMLIQVIVGVVCYLSILALLDSNSNVTRTRQVKENLTALLGQLSDTEAGQRGFTITGEQDFLQPYKAAREAIEGTKANLGTLIVDPAQKESWRELQAPIAAELEHHEKTIKARESDPEKGFAAAVEAVKSRRGQTQIVQIRAITKKMSDRNKELLDKYNEAAQASALIANLAIVLGTFFAVLVAMVGGWVVVRSIAGPVHKLLIGTNKIAQGVLGYRVNLTSHDEIGELSGAFDRMAEKRQQAHEAMREAANQLSAASAEILASTTEQAAGAQEQAAAVTETMSTVDEVTQTSDQAAQRAKAVGESVQRTLEIGKAGRKVVDDSLGAMETVKEKVETTAENILMLAEQAQAISEIIATVNDIAEQTNLLALNAAIEASRAGEHGKGFTVVAGEVKALADQSKKATAQVRQILGEIQKSTNTAVLSTEDVTKGVASAIRVGGQAGETIKTLADTLADTAQATKQIAASVGQQATGMAQINQAMKNIDQVAKQNAVATRQAAQAAENLNALGNRLASLSAE
jgi:methyl-accepting chemotaxis protein